MSRRCSSRLFLFALAAAAGCGTSGACGGCGTMEPIPGGFQGTKQSNAAVLRISQQGFDYLNANWGPLISAVMPTAMVSPDNPDWLEVPFGLPCTVVPDPGFGVGDLYACDNGTGLGTPGYMDAICTTDPASPAYDTPCPVLLTLRSLHLAPTAPDLVDAQAVLTLDVEKDITTRSTDQLRLDSKGQTSSCLWFKRLGCGAEFHSSGGKRPDETVTARMQFKLDPAWDNMLTFEMVAPDPSKPDDLIGGLNDLESDDLTVTGMNRCLDPACKNSEDMCDWVCDAVNLGFIKGLIVDYVVKPQLGSAVKGGLGQQECRACNPSDPLVSTCPAGSTCQCLSGGTCDDTAKVCMGDVAHGGRCVPRMLGFEGRIPVGDLLSKFGGVPENKVDLVVEAGGSAPVLDKSLETGMQGGVKAVNASPCVPRLDPPQPQTIPAPTLDADGPPGYHVGLALSQDFLNRALFQAHQSGTLCLNLESQQVPALSTNIFKIPLPSLGVVAGSDTQDAPMMVVLRPLGAPVLHVGEGTFDPATKKPIKPLITIEVTDVRFDIYALVEDRYVRLFTLAADVKVPVSLIIEGCPMTVLPALGDLSQIVVIRKDVPTNAEILAEDPAALAQLIPMILGMAEPILTSSIKPITVSDMNGFRIKLDKLQGVTRIGTTDDFYYLGAYATLGLAGQCESWGPKSKARLVEARLPSREQMRLSADHPLPWPVAVLDVSAEDRPDKARPMEFAWRVDGGFWSTWFDGPRLTVTHPALIAEGRHRIEVRARIAGEAAMVGPASEPVTLVSDWDPPKVALKADREAGLMRVVATDRVSPPETLRYAYRVGDGVLSAFSKQRPIDLASVEASGTLEVRVMDEAGLVGSALWRAEQSSAVQPRAVTSGAGQAASSSGGCSSAGAGLGLLALALLPRVLRRRRQKDA